MSGLYSTGNVTNQQIITEGRASIQGSSRLGLYDMMVLNTINHYSDKTGKTEGAILTESADTSTTSIQTVPSVVLGVLQRAIPQTIALELVGVSPLSAPTGSVRSLRYENVSAITTQDAAKGLPAGSDIFGTGAGLYNSALSTANHGSATSVFQDFTVAFDDIMFGSASQIPDLENTAGSGLRYEIVTTPVTSKLRKLSASYTPEAAYQTSTTTGINIQENVFNAIATQINLDIDNEIIRDLKVLAGNIMTWDGTAPAVPLAGYIGDRFASLAIMVDQISNLIAMKVRGVCKGATFIVVTPTILSVLKAARNSQFQMAAQGQFNAPAGSVAVGVLNGIPVYSHAGSSYANDNTILIGYKGADDNAGYFFCPYLPVTPFVDGMTDPILGNKHTVLATMYGRVAFTNPLTSLGNSRDYYGRISVTGPVSFQ